MCPDDVVVISAIHCRRVVCFEMSLHETSAHHRNIHARRMCWTTAISTTHLLHALLQDNHLRTCRSPSTALQPPSHTATPMSIMALDLCATNTLHRIGTQPFPLSIARVGALPGMARLRTQFLDTPLPDFCFRLLGCNNAA